MVSDLVRTHSAKSHVSQTDHTSAVPINTTNATFEQKENLVCYKLGRCVLSKGPGVFPCLYTAPLIKCACCLPTCTTSPQKYTHTSVGFRTRITLL
ncbi:unnamed protein product [Diplocarpon coronariae]